MFETPALLSLTLDAITVILYCQFPTIFGEVRNGQLSPEKSWSRFDLNPYHSSCLLILLAGFRFLLFLPNIHQFQFRLPIIAWKRLIKVWHYLNGFTFLTVALVICCEHGINPQTTTLLTSAFSRVQCVLITLGLVSLLCQSICVRHLSTSVILPTMDDYEWRLMPLSVSKNTPDDDSSSMLSSLYYQEVAPICHSKFTKSAQTSSKKPLFNLSAGIPSKNSVNSLVEVQGPVDTLDLLVRLFASERITDEMDRAISISLQNQINQTFQRGVPEVIFFIPQLVVFLYNSLSSHICSYLQDHLLQLCQTSINCAHRVYWFIRATFLANDHESDTTEMLLVLLSMVEDCGESIARKISSAALTGSQSSNIKGLEKSYRQNNNELHKLHGNNCQSSIFKKLSFEIDGSNDHDQPYPLYLAQTPPFLDNNYFQHTISFWDRMCEISRSLSQIPRRERTNQLRSSLLGSCSDYLPSSCIYAPLNIVGSGHRIWSVIADESFAFSTKNRAPIFLCLEIVEYENDENGDDFLNSSNDLSMQKFLSRKHLKTGKVDIFNRKNPVIRTNSKLVATIRHSTGSVVESSSNQRRGQRVSFLSDSSMTVVDISSQECLNASDKSQQSTGQLPEESVAVQGFQNVNNRASLPITDGSSAWSDNKSSSCKPSIEALDIGQWSPLHTKMNSNRQRSPSSEKPLVSNQKNNRSGINSDNLISEGDSNQRSISSPKVTFLFKERWKEKELRLRQASPVGGCKGWRLLPVIIKTRDNLRQEQLVAQLIELMHDIIQEASVNGPGCCWLYSYEIIALSGDSGMIEAIPDTVSIDALKKSGMGYTSLKDFFDKFFVKNPDNYYEASEDEQSGHISLNLALDNYMKSLAGYSIICYLLQIKDRHNGNILLDIEGHIIHIDFGFVLGKTPGGNIGFENAPFKMTAEMVEVLEGFDGKLFSKFRDACVRTFMTLRRQHHRILLALEMIAQCSDDLPCFEGNPKATDDLRSRFCADLHDNAAIEFVHNLVNESLDNWRTDCYDDYQRCCVGIF